MGRPLVAAAIAIREPRAPGRSLDGCLFPSLLGRIMLEVHLLEVSAMLQDAWAQGEAPG